jgi:glucose/arabinose dehydrogenase
MTRAALLDALVACAAAAALSGSARAASPTPAAPAPAAAAAKPDAGDWRGARWGMTEEEVLTAFPGEARRLEKPEKLPDGNTVSIGIDEHAVGATKLRVRFVFDPAGRLALVSLRTDPKTYAEPAAFDATRKALTAEHGQPGASSSDDNFVDLRQVSWWTARDRIDLKYVNGVVVVLYSPTDGGPPPATTQVPPLLAPPPQAPAKK